LLLHEALIKDIREERRARQSPAGRGSGAVPTPGGKFPTAPRGRKPKKFIPADPAAHPCFGCCRSCPPTPPIIPSPNAEPF